MTLVQEHKPRQYVGRLVGLIILVFIIALALLIAFVMWIVFAVRNPNSYAGQCLIQVYCLLACLFTNLVTSVTSTTRSSALIVYNLANYK